MDEGARFPEVAAKAGHYESFYIKACEPGGGRGRLDPAHGSQAPRRRAHRLDLVRPLRPRRGRAARDQGHRARERALGPGGIVDPGRRRDHRARARPRARSTPRRSAAAWSLTFSGEAGPCKYLPADWLYEAPLPRTKFVAPVPHARFEGRLEIDDEESIELTGWPGMIGHNWGSEHAERWVWLEGTGFEDAPGAYFDAGAARVKLGPRTTPWIPSGMLVARRRGAPARRPRRDPRQPRSRSLRPPAPSCCRARTSSSAAASRRRREGLRRLGLRRPEGPRAQHRQLLGRRPRADGGTPRRCRRELFRWRPAPPTRSGCGRPTTASRSSPIRTAESRWSASVRAATG